ncbi:MAG: ATP phosphoribosyltransferase [Leptonema sp. (in: bacteria)]
MNFKKNELSIVLPSGRLSKESIDFLNQIGYSNCSFPENSRELVFYDKIQNVKFILVRNQDVPLIVLNGGGNVGICGKDILFENNYNLTYPIPLPFGFCRLSLAIPKEITKEKIFKKRHIRVATKYPNLTKDYFFKRGINAEIIKLHGSIEISPLLNIADCIVDLVSTGRTLLENGLVEIEVILESSAVLIINRSSYYIWNQKILELIQLIKQKTNILS